MRNKFFNKKQMSKTLVLPMFLLNQERREVIEYEISAELNEPNKLLRHIVRYDEILRRDISYVSLACKTFFLFIGIVLLTYCLECVQEGPLQIGYDQCLHV